MYMVREADIKAWRLQPSPLYPVCVPFHGALRDMRRRKGSKRDEMKELIAELRKRCDTIDMNIFNSVHNINLKTVIGYHKGRLELQFPG